MTTAYWCILAAILLPYIFAPMGQIPGITFEAFKEPRRRQPSLVGWKARSNAAHLNGLEIVPAFASAVIVAHLAGVAQPTIDALALAFIAFRVAHGILYIANLAIPRTVAWAAGLGCVVTLFIQAA